MDEELEQALAHARSLGLADYPTPFQQEVGYPREYLCPVCKLLPIKASDDRGRLPVFQCECPGGHTWESRPC